MKKNHVLDDLLTTNGYLGQSIQEWAKWNLWKTAFKKFEMVWSA